MPNQKDILELTIYRDGVEAGTLKRIQNGSSFTFSPKFLQDSRFDRLSYRIKKANNAQYVTHGQNLHPFFAGLLPEGLRLEFLVKNIKTSRDDLFSLFAASAFHTVGDVYSLIDQREHAGHPVIPKLSQVNFYEHFEALLKINTYAQGEDVFAGVQEKISASMISFPLNIARAKSAYILKLNPKDKPNLVENEYYCMQLAEKCGIDIAQTKLVRDKAGNLGLLVTRFDRVWSEEQSRLLMNHQEDACQFLDRYPADKYRLSMSEIADGINELVSVPRVEILKLLRMYCFSYLIGNGDLHCKNISIMSLLDKSVELTPAYDLICTYIYGDSKMALKLDGRDDNLKRKMLIAFGSRFEVGERAVIRMIDQLVSDFQKHSSLLEKIQIKEKERKKLTLMIKKRIKDLGQTV